MTYLLPILYLLGLYSAYLAGVLYLRNRSSGQPPASFRLPRTTLILFLAVAIPTTLQFLFPGLLSLLQRDTARFLEGEWWRLITPLFVQDGGVSGTIFNLVTLLLVGSVAEQFWSTREMFILFFLGGLAGELVGFAWQPLGAGNSVANFSLAASIAVTCLLRGAAGPVQRAAFLALAADVVLVLLRDIHGPAALAGAVLALAISWMSGKQRIAGGASNE